MTNPDPSRPVEPASTGGSSVQPSRRDRMRPLELLGLSGILALFAGAVALFVMRPWAEETGDVAQDWIIVLIVTGAAFILSIVVFAMLSLGSYSPPAEPDGRVLDDRPGH